MAPHIKLLVHRVGVAHLHHRQAIHLALGGVDFKIQRVLTRTQHHRRDAEKLGLVQATQFVQGRVAAIANQLPIDIKTA